MRKARFRQGAIYDMLTGCRDRRATPPAPVAAVIQASGNRHSIVIKKSYANRLTLAGSP